VTRVILQVPPGSTGSVTGVGVAPATSGP